ncbi:MAG: hypothetical protein ACRCTJ_06975 [Brevinema sp.]
MKKNGLEFRNVEQTPMVQPSLKLNSSTYLQTKGCDMYEQQLDQLKSYIPELYHQVGYQKKQVNSGFFQRIKAIFIKKSMRVEWDYLRQNIYLRLVYHLLKLFWVLIKFISKDYAFKKKH